MKEDSDGFKYIFHSQDVFTRFSMFRCLTGFGPIILQE
jgi:hypothetical protein